MFIRNQDELIERFSGEVKDVIEVLEAGLKAADPFKAVLNNLRIEGSKLKISNLSFEFKGIYVVGAGKASGKMAEAVEKILADKIRDGVVIVPRGTGSLYKLNIIRVWEGDHPIPSERSVEGSLKILEVLENVEEDDIVIALLSGGGSALMTLPVEGVSINDIQQVTNLLLKSGARIQEVNAVRKHLSRIKGGWLAKYAQPARVISLIISDVVGDDLDTIASGPTTPDPTTFKDAYQILVKYEIFNKVPQSVREYIEKGLRGEVPETPKPGDPIFRKVYNKIVASNIISLKAMEEKARELGYNTLLLTSVLEGEAREAGKVFASIALEVLERNIPVKKPAFILAGGETTVTVRGRGRGGRNQEFVLGAALKIRNRKGVYIAALGSDGIDGITDAAGAIVDYKTAIIGEEKGLTIEKALKDNDSYTYLKRVGGLIFTGATGTNVNDLYVALVKGGSAPAQSLEVGVRHRPKFLNFL
ncbi:MAG TPA: glycerate kinase [Thermoproteales archaeon]|nr:glycerate kinase [Thermoproteales archaeon]